jgi:hypothetical protein
VPESDILCGLFCALSEMTTLPDRKPLAAGLKVRSIVQLDLTASELGQLLVSLKSRGFAPVMSMPVIVSDVVPVFVSVTALALLLVFTFCVPKFRPLVLSWTRGLMTTAVRLTVCGLTGELSVTFRVAVWVVYTVPASNSTLIVQLFPVAKDAGQRL